MTELQPIGAQVGERAYMLALNDFSDFQSLLKVSLERMRQRADECLGASDAVRSIDHLLADLRFSVAYLQLLDLDLIRSEATFTDARALRQTEMEKAEEGFVRIAAYATLAASFVRESLNVEDGLFG